MTLAFKVFRIRGVELLILEVHDVGTICAQTSNMAHKIIKNSTPQHIKNL
jgi:hypothetical protein